MSALGFDTSNYTTSAAVSTGVEVVQARKILPVKPGERGLRQSDALFQHIKQLPDVIAELKDINNITSVGVSVRPRNVDGSYMPVFLAGVSFAETAAKVIGVPVYKFSHQDGHIMAGIMSCKSFELLDGDFLTVHISGGTTEIIKTRYNGMSFDANLVGGTKDISAGQLIDRVGVANGIKFPCGKELDELSLISDCPVKLPTSVKDGYFNFSGLENKALGFADAELKNIAAGVFFAVSKTLTDAIDFCCRKYNIYKVLVVGGVSASTFVRNYLTNKLQYELYFATPELSSDNACGIAELARLCSEGGNFGF